MIRRPALPRHPRGTKYSAPDSIPAPTGGWNTRDPLASMSPKDALWLENWWPGTGKVELRKGAQYHVQGFTGKVESLLSYNASSSAAAPKLFAATEDTLYDVSSAGIPATSILALQNGRFRYSHFSPVGTNYIAAVNGEDDLLLYNGTTWQFIDDTSTPAITGHATADFTNIAVFKRRLWFVQRDSMSAWYLPVDSIAGALTEFPVGQLFSKGGYLVAMESWTIDGGLGPDDYLVFLTSEGEVAVYKGTDPSVLASFTLVGIAFIGKPLGPNSLLRMGGEVLVLTEGGVFPMSRAYRSASISARDSLSSKVDPKLAEVIPFYRESYGWDMDVFPNEQCLIINVPTSDGKTSSQFVMNTLTNAWALFSGWNAFCWEATGSALYFGGDGYVAQAFLGSDDFGLDIKANARTSFNYMRMQGSKHFKLVRPVIHASEAVTVDFGVDVDFNETEDVNFVQQGAGGSGGGSNPLQLYWDSAIWDSAIWASDSTIRSFWWTAFAMPGFCMSARLRVVTKGVNLGWSSTDVIYQPGTGL